MARPTTALPPQAAAQSAVASGRATSLNRPFRFAEWRADPVANEVTREGRTTRVEPKAMLLLACLAGRAERPVTREALAAAIWPDVVVGEDSLSRLVFQLRRALGEDSRRPRCIETLPKVGYRLAMAIEPLPLAKRMRAPGRPAAAAVVDPSPRLPMTAGGLLLIAVLGGTCGWWSGRRIARSRFRATDRALANRSR